MHKVLVGLPTAVFVTAALMTASPAGAAATHTLALWNMNEVPGSTTLVDSSGSGINGTIGDQVLLNGSYDSFWYGQQPNSQHLDLVDSPLLNPGTRGYAVTVRFKGVLPNGNLLQKGQSGAIGGYFKIQLDSGGGRVLCTFVGLAGSGSVWSSTKVDDGLWHVVTCARTATQVSVTVDERVVGVTAHATGRISNTWPLSIGGKSQCNQVTVWCDYYTGQVDYVLIQTS